MARTTLLRTNLHLPFCAKSVKIKNTDEANKNGAIK